MAGPRPIHDAGTTPRPLAAGPATPPIEPATDAGSAPVPAADLVLRDVDLDDLAPARPAVEATPPADA